MKLTRRVFALLVAAVLTVGTVLPVPAMADSASGLQATILFTHDLHSHLLPASDGEGGVYGGYARLKTVIDQQKRLHPDALLVDGGDFSMGSLFQTAYATSATELRVMRAMGYDVTTFGNHEYDYRDTGLADMLNAALASGEPLPAIVEANYLPPTEGEEGYAEGSQAVWEAFESYGVEQEYLLMERGGVWFAIFGINGVDSDVCAPMSGMILHDQVETARAIVEAARAECLESNGVEPLVLCLSHSGTDGKGRGEDYELAKKVDGIDVIVSGHTHTTLYEPIQVNDTLIVSCGEYSKYLGVLTVDYGPTGGVALSEYELIPIDRTVEDNVTIQMLVEGYKREVEESYLARFDMSFDQVLAHNPYTFDSVGDVYATAHESTLGNLLSDAYRWAAERATGERVDMALTASGVIRETLAKGDLTVSDVFNVASLGIGADGVPGYPLVAVYLTGADLRNVLEVDASVYPLMNSAQLFCSGVEYRFNTKRMIFNKVTGAALRRDNGVTEPIRNDQLYRVVTSLYCGQMLGAVERSSFGLLTVTARDKNGEPIDMDRLEDYIIHDAGGGELKEWYAIATYLQSMGGEIEGAYGQTDGRKVVYASWNPVELLRNSNKFTIILIVVLLVLILVVVLVIRLIVRKVCRGGDRGYRAYRGRRRR